MPSDEEKFKNKKIIDFNLQEDENCSSCTEGCSFPRPNGCFHKCPKPCHPNACDQCNVRIKVTCHCTLTQVYYKCCDFYINDIDLEHKAKQEKMQSCGNRCIKNVKINFFVFKFKRI